MNICVLGRQPAIGLAELESLYGADAVRPIDGGIATVDADIDFDRLGSVVKSAEYLATVESTNAQKVFDYARRALPEFVADFPEGKIKLGTSLYGLDMPVPKQNANTLSLKKVLKGISRSVRVVPNTDPALSSAQTYHNQLTSDLGCELVFVRDGTSTLIGRVTHVQNINEYTERDRDRPRRDARVGMLPPKLAQTIINLASGKMEPQNAASADEEQGSGEARTETYREVRQGSTAAGDTAIRRDGRILLDPFCGTGVVLQEAGLMGYDVYGTDIEERMIRYTRDNLNWLMERSAISFDRYYEVADATDHTWRQPVDIVACEGYLGTPFASEPPEAALKDSIQTCNIILKKFLGNIHGQLAPGTRLCIAAPSWFVRGRTHHLPCIGSLNELGYERVLFQHASPENLTYHREDQIVGRELLVLTTI